MEKKSIDLAFALLLLVCFNVSTALAQGAKDDLKEKLTEVRQKKAVITNEHKAELAKINKASDEKVAEIRAEFHKKRDACLQDKKNKTDELTQDYDVKIKPLAYEEKDILQAMVPQGGMNFAKTKDDRQ